MSMREQALVLFSGGQDSTTCLARALANFASVETEGFDYGQRHEWGPGCGESPASHTGGRRSYSAAPT